ncbi:TMV resistance protein N-like [Prosopis cineraria]|uniref:TMV resistance protein N-like n=1 Tax=Prosopis cineraria TaxID=364024 RepID=UPI00240F160E|nr:TMV resistance protein N-like [Prosopis cineraria]
MSSSFAPSSSKSYDVVITLRDTNHPVKAYLEDALGDAGIIPFFDDAQMENLFGRNTISIRGCRIAMIIFTRTFLDSDRCLERVVQIMDCHRTMKIQVLPVFCDLGKREVQEFMYADRSLERDFALAEVIDLSGFTLSSEFSINDEGEINNLVAKLNQYLLGDLPNHAMQLQLRVREVIHLSKTKHFPMKGATVIGIWGASGIGKTTVAKAIYDKIGKDFESKIFIESIKDVWEKDDERVIPQKQLLLAIYKIELSEINDIELTLQQLDQTLCRRTLLVLDDVDRVEQLRELCGQRNNVGKGSLIFITTRNRDLLDPFVDESYEMRRLDNNDSLSLFSVHAFRKLSPTDDFENLSTKVMIQCEGLPLALEVIGSLLHNRVKSEWKRILNKLKAIVAGQVQQKLKISLDFLTDLEKDLFFNIVCFYVGQRKDDVTKLLKGQRFPVEKVMPLIIKRRIVKVVNGKLLVHDLLQEVGREISPYKPMPKYFHDVFLSFRGEDTRKSFTTHLYNALKQAGIKVFIDDQGLGRGENISSSLMQAIKSSRISIVVFSKNYIGSHWCLQELEKIMECHKATFQEVLPIFYDVRPSEFRKQQNTFRKFLMYWRSSNGKSKKLTTNLQRALTEAANLSGWDMQNYRIESELIDHVTETITMKLNDNKSLFIAHHPVGVKSRVQEIMQLLNDKPNEVIIVGIWGMGGMGKTTIAKAIYNEIGQRFDGKNFLANVREVWKQDNGPVYLQEQLLTGILRARRVTLPSIERGETLVKEMLCNKKAFIVLDDVNNEDQLKALCGSRDWFGQGSRIIITTRDERLFKILGVDKVYTMKEMDDDESLELFSWHVFKQAVPKRDFFELSRRIVSYSGGLPLALEVLGCYLFDREIMLWESVLEKLKQIPNDQIHKKLKISYDGLSDHTEKDLFLDICCFFIGKDISYATQILNGCGLHADIGINRLIERSLVKIGNKNKLDMHDLLRDMGREIIREQSPEELEKRARLWFHDDVLDVLKNSTGTIAIKGLALNLSRNNSLSLSTKAFKKMKRLRLLQLDRVKLDGDYGYLSKELRWLCWQGFPLENMPMNLSLEKVVAIDLKWSNLIKVWEKSQLLERLKILNLSHSHYLIETPNFSMLPNLKKLILKDCLSLSMIHPSLGDLKYIILLNLKDCKSLRDLPRNIYKLRSLNTLNLFGCSKIEKLEEDIEQMESLTTLMANQTAITQVPFSLVRMKSIKYVSLCGYEGLSRDVFPSIVLSWVSPTNHSKSLFQSFGIMPSLIKGLSHPSRAKSHEILEAIPSTSQASCRNSSTLIGFQDQIHMERSETFMSSLTIHVGGFNKVIDALLKNISQGCSERGFGDSSLPKDNHPEWLSFKGEGSSILFEVPQIFGRSLKGMIICITYLSSQDNMTLYPVGVLVSNRTKTTIKLYEKDATTTSEDEEWKNIISNWEPGNRVEVIVTFACELTVKKTAIYLVYDEDFSKRIMYH